jgi:acetyl-CoA carboxylase biotin carboxyl carrier protein
VDLSDLKDILRMLEEQEITEFELEQDGVKLRVCRSIGAEPQVAAPSVVTHYAAAAPAPPVAPVPPTAPAREVAAAPSAPAVPPAVEDEAIEGGTPVPSPIVGTFYRSADPDSEAFVSVGDHVRVGQVLCIVEAMKLMNEIEAEMAGEILKVHLENGQPVQYGDPLFTIRPA